MKWLGVTGKLKKIDENNLSGEDDVVFLSIYDCDTKKYYDSKIKLQFDTREDNKKQIIDNFIQLFLKIK